MTDSLEDDGLLSLCWGNSKLPIGSTVTCLMDAIAQCGSPWAGFRSRVLVDIASKQEYDNEVAD